MTEPLACDRALLRIAAAAELPLDERRALHDHLEGCAACRRTFEAIAEPASDDLLELPEVPADAYRREGERRRGGMGSVVRAFDRRLGRYVALKEPLDEAGAARFVREARLAARVEHPAIVAVHEAGRWDDGGLFYAMQLVDGRTLDEELARCATFEARAALLPHVIVVADAIAYAHEQRVIHRDLKPANIMIGRRGEAVVIDWGLATLLPGDDQAPAPGSAPLRSTAAPGATAVGAGTPQYMPPEQIFGDVPDERWDVYALGATLYHVLTGEPPYGDAGGAGPIEAILRGPPRALAEVEPRTPAELLAIVARAMARDPRARYANAAAVADELRAFQAGRLVAAHRYSALDRIRRWIRRHRAIAAVTAIAIAGIAALGAWSAQRILAEQRRAEDRALILAERVSRDEDQAVRASAFVRARLDAYLELSRLAGAVATAADAAAARRALDELERAGARVHDGDHPALVDAIARLREALPAGWFGVIADRAALGTQALAVPRAVRSSWGQITAAVAYMAGDDVRQRIAELERAHLACPLLAEAIAATRGLREGGAAAADRFWGLYWGKLYFIETERLRGEAVEAAMVRLGARVQAGEPLDGAIADLERAAAAMQDVARCRDRRP